MVQSSIGIAAVELAGGDQFVDMIGVLQADQALLGAVGAAHPGGLDLERAEPEQAIEDAALDGQVGHRAVGHVLDRAGPDADAHDHLVVLDLVTQAAGIGP